jgi:hypothetical protein
MGIRRTILTSGRLASAIGICLAILSAGTLVTFSVIAAKVGLGDLSNEATVASPSNATKGPPAAITFPSEQPSEENERTSPSNTSLLDIVGSAIDASTSTDAIADTVGPDVSVVRTDTGPEQVAVLISDVDLGGRNPVSGPGERSPRSGDEKQDEPRDENGTDRVAVRKDDDDVSDHGDDEDDDDDSDTSGARGGSSNDSRDSSRDGDGAARVHTKAAKAKAHAKKHSKAVDVDEPKTRKGHDHDSHHGDDDDDSDSSDS